MESNPKFTNPDEGKPIKEMGLGELVNEAMEAKMILSILRMEPRRRIQEIVSFPSGLGKYGIRLREAFGSESLLRNRLENAVNNYYQYILEEISARERLYRGSEPDHR